MGRLAIIILLLAVGGCASIEQIQRRHQEDREFGAASIYMRGLGR